MRTCLGVIVLAFAIATIPACNCDSTIEVDASVPIDGEFIDAPRPRDAGRDARDVRDAGPPGEDAVLAPDAFVRPDVGTDAFTPDPVCGDGIVDGLEQCDDGNTDDGDGCSAMCAIEAGFACAGEPSVCTPDCGDGVITGSETCDDGGRDPGDGCSATCQVETGWTCPPGMPTAGCTFLCGDGVAAVGVEECDDGNGMDGDGCDDGIGPDTGAGPDWLPACLLTRCGNGIPTAGEQCDDGNTVPGDGCDENCQIE